MTKARKSKAERALIALDEANETLISHEGARTGPAHDAKVRALRMAFQWSIKVAKQLAVEDSHA